MRLVSGFIVGLGLAVAQGCGARATFACGDDSDCTLSGQAGVCTEGGNCAYPSDGCASGWSYPEGAPGGLAGMCVDVGMGTGGSSSTGSAATADPQTDTTAAGGSTSSTSQDPATTQSVSASGDSTSGAASSDTMFGTDSSGSNTTGCVPDLFELDPTADAFMATTCGAMDCATLNFGTSLLHAVGSDAGGGGAVFALRFDARQVPPRVIFGAAVTLRLSVGDAMIQGGDVEVWALDGNYPWGEGGHDGAQATMGESCWDFAMHDDTPWPGEGPISAATTFLGSNPLPPAPDGTLELVLDADAVSAASAGGADSMLVVSGAQQAALTVYSRESNLPPVLVFGGC